MNPGVELDWTGLTEDELALITPEMRELDLASPSQAVCTECDRGVWWAGQGKKPAACHRHRRIRKRGDGPLVLVPLIVVESFDDLPHRSRVRSANDMNRERLRHADSYFGARRIAAFFKLTKNWNAAAGMAGFDMLDEVKADEIAMMIDVAAHDPALEGIRLGRQSAAGTAAATVLQVLCERLLSEMYLVPAKDLAKAIQALSQAVKQLGGYQTDFSNVRLSMGMRRGAVVDMLRAIKDDPENAEQLADNALQKLKAGKAA